MTLTVGWYVKSFRIFAPGTDHFRMAPRVYLKSVISSARNNMSQMSASAMADLLSPGPFDPNLRGLLYLDCLRFVSYGVYGCRTKSSGTATQSVLLSAFISGRFLGSSLTQGASGCCGGRSGS